jgi:hypothetical protein
VSFDRQSELSTIDSGLHQLSDCGANWREKKQLEVVVIDRRSW